MILTFDLWGTLIKGNRHFKEVKCDLIRSLSVTPVYLEDSTIEAEIKKIKYENDSIIETYGTQPDSYHLFARMCDAFMIPSSKLMEFFYRYQDLFTRNPPQFYCDDTLEILRRLKDEGHKMNISSNTLFTSVEAMNVALNNSTLYDIFTDVKLFSGDVGWSKPHKTMFVPGTDLHIGDNIKTDGGSEEFGIEFFQINTNGKTIIDAYDYIKQYDKVLIA